MQGPGNFSKNAVLVQPSKAAATATAQAGSVLSGGVITGNEPER